MQTLVSGTYKEDFNYGYPYDAQFVISPPQFRYSGSERTNAGIYASNGYRRKDFRLHYLAPSSTFWYSPFGNTDIYQYGGSHSLNPYYFNFPKLSWNDCQVLTLTVTLTADGVLTYDRAWDGHSKDTFRLVVNGVERKTVTGTSGYYWTTDTISLRRGKNRISWVVTTSSYIPTIGRDGTIVSGTLLRTPVAYRILRLNRLQITKVSAIPQPPTGYVNSRGDASMSSPSGVLRAVSGDVTLRGDSMLSVGRKNMGAVYLTGGSTFVTNAIQMARQGSMIAVAEAFFTVDGTVKVNHEAMDGGFHVETGGSLTVMFPADTVQTVQSLIRPLQKVVQTMTAPVIVQGRPIQPRYPSSTTSTSATTGAYIYTNRVNPTSVSHVLPVAETFRWLSVDVGGAEDADVTSWPCHTAGGPAWTSTGLYCPSVTAHEHYYAKKDYTVSYSRVVNFWWRYVQHMWLVMPAGYRMTSTPTPYTWTFVGIMHRPSAGQYNHILDVGLATPDYTEEVLDSEEVYLEQKGQSELANNARAYFGIRPTGIEVKGNNTAKTIFKPVPALHFVPCVYTVIFNNAATSKVNIRGYNINETYTFNSGQSLANDFVLGRSLNRVGHLHASHMSLMEVAYHNRALTQTEIVRNANWLASVYQFNLYR